MESPVITENMKSILISDKGFSTLYDIVWSFDYYLENITETTEFAFTFFLQDASINVESYSTSVDLGYSSRFSYADIFRTGGVFRYLRPGGTFSYYRRENIGLAGGLLGVGFDSTGCFALSTYEIDVSPDFNEILRDGKDDSERIPNSVAIRGPAPEYHPRKYYSFNDYNVYYALTGFNIVDSTKKTVRARLGNLGRTFYVDYRRSPNEDFINILTESVTLPTTRHRSTSAIDLVRPGITLTKPVSSSSLSATPIVIVENFHAEGKESQPILDSGTAFIPITSIMTLDTPVVVLTGIEIPPAPDALALPQAPIEPFAPKYTSNQQDSASVSVSIVSSYTVGYDIYQQPSYDVFNFGYTLSAGGDGLLENIILTRREYFNYTDISNTITLSLESFNNVWVLSISGRGDFIGSNKRPVGEYRDRVSPYLPPINIRYL